jgi:hypothetical protein
MKLALGPLVVTLATVTLGMMLGGCGPGLTSHAAKAPADVFRSMDAELANAIGTTSLTSADAPSMRLPDERMSVSGAKADDAPPPVQTWGASRNPTDEDLNEYGF